MISYETYKGGGDTNGGVQLNPATIYRLSSDHQWCYFNVVSNANPTPVFLLLPFAKGLPIGTTIRLIFTASSNHDTQIVNAVSLQAQNVFDRNGVPRTVVDHGILRWTDTTSIDAVLLDNSTGNGFWVLNSWGND